MMMLFHICNEKKGSFIYASNFSLGVNIFFEFNRQLSQMMNALEDYTVSIEEIHHTKKLDAPSGTAITSSRRNYRKRQIKKIGSWELNQVITIVFQLKPNEFLKFQEHIVISYDSEM